MRRTYGQHCPIARSLDLLGERWTFLLIRDLSWGPVRFSELKRRFPELAPNLLSERLRSLTAAGLVERLPERQGYVITEHGWELRFAVLELARFGMSLLDDLDTNPFPPHLRGGGLLALARPEHLDRAGWSALVDLGHGVVHLEVRPGRRGLRPLARLEVVLVADDATPPPSDIQVTATAAALYEGRRADISIKGPEVVAERFAALFGVTAP